MTRFDSLETVAHIVAAFPPAARVFERHGIDYCCGGKIPVAEACAKRGLETDLVLAELEAAATAAPKARDWTNATAGEVIDHVLGVHHEYVKREIPRLSTLMEKVNRVHGPSHPGTIPVIAGLWRTVSAELSQHLDKEEEILFPMIKAMESGRPVAMHCGVEGPVHVMEIEHEVAGQVFARMRELAQDYVAPEEACGSWRALWSGLDEFERDLHAHVHLENHVLFPRALALEGASA